MRTNVLAHARVLPPAAVLPAFAATLFLSAGLMFLVEPMVAKMVLPRLGGSPAVWSTCLVFFQAMLLLGYGYAHVLTRLLSRPAQILVHVALVLPIAMLVLPPDLGAGAPPPDEPPALWLLLRLALVSGPPVFAISATAPLLQSWFADVEHERAHDPYFLYAVSNAGSLLALLAYPLLVDPALSLRWQATLWSIGFCTLAVGIALCALMMVLGAPGNVADMRHTASAPATLRQRLTWMMLAFVPSSLLLGVTAHITTDIASAPLLWVVPLMLYLLTYILAFARRPPLRHEAMGRLLPLVLIPLVVIAAPGSSVALPVPLLLTLHLSCFFVIGMVCHGELARRRPPATQLTEFYFFLAVGGVLGGAFNALLAPLIFSGVWEYPLALIAACMVKPTTPEDAKRGLAWDIVLPLALLCLLLLTHAALRAPSDGGRLGLLVAVFSYIVPALVLMNFSPRRWRFALGVVVVLVSTQATAASGVIATHRSFFGVYRIRVVDESHGLALINGTTMHGVKSLVPGEERLPMAYYSPQGAFGRFFSSLSPDTVRHVAVVGLGTGELACYAQPDQDWTFYEIDPLVERLARDPRYFQFLANCGNRPRVVLGDARMTINGAPDATYDVLVIDAFSSDSIPMHLLTREALALYLQKLAPGGHLLFHISSRTLKLAPVVAALASDAGVPARMLFDRPPPGTSGWRRSPALVVALAGRGGDLDRMDSADGWTAMPPGKSQFLWTDQRSDLVRSIRFGF